MSHASRARAAIERRRVENAAGHVSWVAVRPPRLLDKTARGSYRTGTTAGQVGGAITIADLADALVDFAEADEPTGGVYVSN